MSLPVQEMPVMMTTKFGWKKSSRQAGNTHRYFEGVEGNYNYQTVIVIPNRGAVEHQKNHIIMIHFDKIHTDNGWTTKFECFFFFFLSKKLPNRYSAEQAIYPIVSTPKVSGRTHVSSFVYLLCLFDHDTVLVGSGWWGQGSSGIDLRFAR